MPRRWRHSRSYHEWSNTTPVIDAVMTIVAAASVVIGAHALLFFVFAMRDHDDVAAAENALFLVAIFIANGLFDGLRHWRRHHG